MKRVMLCLLLSGCYCGDKEYEGNIRTSDGVEMEKPHYETEVM